MLGANYSTLLYHVLMVSFLPSPVYLPSLPPQSTFWIFQLFSQDERKYFSPKTSENKTRKIVSSGGLHKPPSRNVIVIVNVSSWQCKHKRLLISSNNNNVTPFRKLRLIKFRENWNLTANILQQLLVVVVASPPHPIVWRIWNIS